MECQVMQVDLVGYYFGTLGDEKGTVLRIISSMSPMHEGFYFS